MSCFAFQIHVECGWEIAANPHRLELFRKLVNTAFYGSPMFDLASDLYSTEDFKFLIHKEDYVYFLGDPPVSMLTVSTRDSSKDTALFQFVCTLQEHIAKGLQTRLQEKAEQEAFDRNIKFMEAEVYSRSPATRMYKHRGYKNVSHFEDKRDERSELVIVFRKAIKTVRTFQNTN